MRRSRANLESSCHSEFILLMLSDPTLDRTHTGGQASRVTRFARQLQQTRFMTLFQLFLRGLRVHVWRSVCVCVCVCARSTPLHIALPRSGPSIASQSWPACILSSPSPPLQAPGRRSRQISSVPLTLPPERLLSAARQSSREPGLLFLEPLVAVEKKKAS